MMPAPESEMDEWRNGAVPQTDAEKLDWLCWWLEGIPNKEMGAIAPIIRGLQSAHVEDVHSNLKLQDDLTAAKPFIEKELLRKMIEPNAAMMLAVANAMRDNPPGMFGELDMANVAIRALATFIARDLGYSEIGE